MLRLYTDDLIRDTEKNVAAGVSDDFTDLFKYAYEKGKTETIEDFMHLINLNSEYARPVGWTKETEIICVSIVRDIAEQLKEQK